MRRSSTSRERIFVSSRIASRWASSAGCTPSTSASRFPCTTERGVRSSWLTSARSRRRCSSPASSRLVMALNARARARASRDPRSRTRVERSPSATRPTASITSPSGAASRRSDLAASKKPYNTTSSPTPRATFPTVSGDPSAVASVQKRTVAPTTEKTAAATKNIAMRRMKPPRPQAGPAQPRRGGNGSFSGHHGGRRRWESHRSPLTRPAPRSGSRPHRP